jgi:hypothetical protein
LERSSEKSQKSLSSREERPLPIQRKDRIDDSPKYSALEQMQKTPKLNPRNQELSLRMLKLLNQAPKIKRSS